MLKAVLGKVSANGLHQSASRGFASLFSKRKPTRKDLEKYDVVIIGCNLGGILSRHFDKATNGKYNVMVVLDSVINQQYPMRGVYEQQRANKTEYLANAKLALSMYTAHSDNIGVDKILPEDNAIILRSGRRIAYDQLVVAMGLNEDFEGIQGFEEAWKHPEHPVFACKDHPTWRSILHKYARWHFNFNSGDAYFCIPPYPFKGEIGGYNFFISNQIWKWYSRHGKLSPKHSFTIVNANDKFVQNLEVADQFIKEKINQLGIKVEYGWRLVAVDMNTQTATFENVNTKERQQRPYNNLYTLIPTKPHPSLVDSGLATAQSNWMLDVDPRTLRHRKYKNIFGLGDVNNIPTTKTFWGGFAQLSVVRNNVARNLQGQSLNAQYDGYTKANLYLGHYKMTYVIHYYDGKTGFANLLDKNGGPISVIQYLLFGKFQKKKFLDYYLKVKGLKKFKGDGTEKDEGKGIAGYFATNKNQPAETKQASTPAQ